MGDIGYDIAMPRMHQTTLRFGPDLWAALVSESTRSGVSVAQYVRDAAVARLALATNREPGLQQPEFPTPLADGGEPVPPGEPIGAQLSSAEAVRAQGQLARDRARRLRSETDAEAVRVQGQLARDRAKRLRSETEVLRKQTTGGSR
jgi:hypothetical protein